MNLLPNEPVNNYIFTENDLRTELNALSNHQRDIKIADYLSDVMVNWNEVSSKNLILKLKKAKEIHNDMHNSTVKPIEGVSFNEPKYYWLGVNLSYESTNNGISDAVKLIEGKLKISEISKSASETFNIIMQLRRLDDVLLRILISSDIADDLSLSIEEVMAIYRIEGNLNVPPSASSLHKNITTRM